VSPHLAARREGRSIDLRVAQSWVAGVRAEADAVVLELPGGLFSPLTDEQTNADLLRMVEPSKVVLVAPDRLGVLHDVITTTRTARAAGLVLDGIVLGAPAQPDASTGTNADELARVARGVPVLATLPRAESADLEPLLARVFERLSL
jgi:dethiobiotin synthetase